MNQTKTNKNDKNTQNSYILKQKKIKANQNYELNLQQHLNDIEKSLVSCSDKTHFYSLYGWAFRDNGNYY